MRSLFTLLAAGLLAVPATAQTWTPDSAVTGPGYANDVYYSLKNGTAKVVTNKNWTLAFQTSVFGNVGFNVSILANHIQDTVSVYSLGYSASAKFASLTAADTVGRTGRQLYNSDSSFSYGAFNRNGGSNAFDFGWGKYNINTHFVTGDSLYLLRVGSRTYKFWPMGYISTPADSVRYEFRIASFNGSGDTVIKLYRKPNFSDRQFAYYHAGTQTIVDREPSASGWDLLFTRYMDTASQGSTVLPYAVTGVLGNLGNSIAEVRKVNPDSVTYQNQTYLTAMNVIGYDWKTLNMQTFQFMVDTTTTYFVKAKTTNEYYQLVFTRFGGSSTGKYYFKKRFVGVVPPTPTSIATVTNEPVAFLIAPNPAASQADVMLDAAVAGTARLFVTDVMGRTVQSFPVDLKQGLNAFRLQTGAFPAGNYFVTVAGAAWKQTQQLSVQH